MNATALPVPTALLTPKYVEALEDAARMGRYIPAMPPHSRKLGELGFFELASRERGAPEEQLERATVARPIWKLSERGRAEVVARFGGKFTQHACGLYLWSRSPLERCPQCKAAIQTNLPARIGDVLRADPVVGEELRRRAG